MCDGPRQLLNQVIGFYSCDRRKVEAVVEELRNEFLDHDGRVISTANGLVTCVDCSEHTVKRMRAFVDERLPRPTGKPR